LGRGIDRHCQRCHQRQKFHGDMQHGRLCYVGQASRLP